MVEIDRLALSEDACKVRQSLKTLEDILASLRKSMEVRDSLPADHTEASETEDSSEVTEAKACVKGFLKAARKAPLKIETLLYGDRLRSIVDQNEDPPPHTKTLVYALAETWAFVYGAGILQLAKAGPTEESVCRLAERICPLISGMTDSIEELEEFYVLHTDFVIQARERIT